MKLKSIAFGILVLIGLTQLGCGGNGSLPLDRGEGSIPVGRAQAADIRAVNVQLRSGSTEYNLVPDQTGLIYLPGSMALGTWAVKVTAEGSWTEEITIEAGAEVFDTVLLPSTRAGDVSSVSFDRPELQLRLGETHKLRWTVSGINTNGLRPSLWLDKPIGSMTPGGVFKAKAIGTAVLQADILGRRASMSVTVLP